MIVGKLICAKCGKDCSKLWGFMLGVRGVIRDRMMQQELDKVKEEFGEQEFVICWGCTAKAFGIKTLAEKKEIEDAKTPEIPKEKIEKKETPDTETVKAVFTTGE